MKVLSIIQPWATLIAIGEKSIETRSWKTKYRGDLLIHASKKINKAICQEEPFKSVLEKHGYSTENLPTGVILAKCSLNDCLQMKHDDGVTAQLENDFIVRENEYWFGDYTPKRYAWILSNITQVNPIQAKGKLNLWEFDFV